MTSAGRVTAEDVARAAGVSRNTVSLAVRDSPLVLPATKERVLAAADRLGYQPHAAAAALRSSRSKTIGYLTRAGLGSEVWAEVDVFSNVVWHAIADTAQQRDYHVLQSQLTDRRRRRALLSSGRVDGLLMDLSVPDEAVADIEAAARPAVVVGRSAPGSALPWVKADEAGGAAAAAEHLAALGHTDIAILSVRWRDHPIVADRESGFERGLREHGLPSPPARHFFGDWTFESGHDITARMLRSPSRPTALFALNELMAAGCLGAAREAGVDVPGQLSVVTVADSHWVDHIHPTLTAVHVPMHDVASRATTMLLDMLAGGPAPKPITIPTTLITRASSGPAATCSRRLPEEWTACHRPRIDRISCGGREL